MLKHDDACVAIGCDRKGLTYLIFYDHHDCLLARSEILLAPVCMEHAQGVNENMTRAHLQCMGWDADASLISKLFSYRL